MACLNCTTRVLRIFLHTSQLPLRSPLLPLPVPLPLLRPATLQRPSYARLTTHLTARKQSTLATLGGELTDDDYVPFDYHLVGTAPAAIGSGVQSGWPPPVPEAGHMERDPDIELTSPHEGVVWWDSMEEQAVVVEKKDPVFLKREAYWTLDGGTQTYSLTPKNNKGRRRREREERERLAAAALPPLEEKGEIDAVAVLAPVVGQTTNTAGSNGVKESKEIDREGNNEGACSAESLGAALEKAARKAARKAWEEKKAAREAKIALKEARKATRSLGRGPEGRAREAAGGEAAATTEETEGEPPGVHKYDQFFSDMRKATTTERSSQALRDTPGYSKSLNHRKISPGTPQPPRKSTLQQEKRLNAVPDVPESLELFKAGPPVNKWDLKIPELAPEPTHLQKWVATGPRNKIKPWQIYKARLQEKFKGQAWAPPKKLSPDAQEAIRVLRRNHPEITTEMLADKFEVSGEAIRRILKSKWREQVKTPEMAQEWAERWAKRGQKVWQRWEEAGVVQTKKTKRLRKMGTAKVIQEGAKVEKVPMVDMSSLSDRLL